MNTMQCIICGRFADGSAHTRGGNSPDMLIQVHVSFVCWTCKHRMLGLDCFNVMFVLPVSDRQNLLQHTHTHTHTHTRARERMHGRNYTPMYLHMWRLPGVQLAFDAATACQ